ncbi:MAG: hypothetical protein V4604_03840 [Bacteroidota bacterium]
MENKYKEGETVYAIVKPTERLIIRRYIPRIYYCTSIDNPNQPETVYFERELMRSPELASE